MEESTRPHRSVSQLNKYRQCSELYRLSYIDKTNNHSPAAWTVQGKAFHEAVEIWENSGRSPQVDIESTYRLSYDRQILELKALEPDPKKWLHSFKITTEEDIKNRREVGAAMVLRYKSYAENNPFEIADIDDYTLAIEVEFQVEIGGTLIKGAVDQVLLHPAGYEVRDLKTGNREQGLLQLGVYTVAMEKIFGWPIFKASYYYAKDDKVVTVSRTELDRYDEKFLGEMFSALEKGIESKIFIPNPGSHCTVCPVRNSCREMGNNPIALS